MIEVLGTEDTERWTHALETLPEGQRDIYFTPDHARLYEGPDRAPRCFVFTEGRECFLHVFVERRLPRIGRLSLDPPPVIAEGVYGYGGPVASTDDPAFLARAHAALTGRQRAASIASEFVRFHPLLGNWRLALPSWNPQFDRHTVAIDLSVPHDGSWRREYTPTHRNRIRRAERAGVLVEASSAPGDYAAFTQLYLETMARVGAAPFYRFSAPYFEGLRSGLGTHVHLFVARLGGRVVAAALILAYARFLHHHLSGSAPDARQTAPNNLLFDAIARWGAERGYRWFHLGGGRTPAPDDDLLRFKARFARPRFEYFTGRGVYDEAAHLSLREAWLAEHPEHRSAAQQYFQVYALEEGPTAP